MKTRSFSCFLIVCAVAHFLAASSSRAADLLWTNWGTITTPPQIDAINFENRGRIDIFTELFFETSNTRNYTNSGVMTGIPGWHFATLPSNSGSPQPAANFVNQDGGAIYGVDTPNYLIIGGTPGVPIFQGLGSLAPSYLWVEADNIVNMNNSLLSVGANGWLRLRGKTINLNRGALQVEPIEALGSGSINPTNFAPDAAIYDTYWALDTIGIPPGVPTGGIWSGGIASAPAHDITTPGGLPAQRFAFSFNATHADSMDVTNFGITVGITNVLVDTNFPIELPGPGQTVSNVPLELVTIDNVFIATNITRQGVFVSVSDPSVMMVEIDWRRSSIFTNYYWTPQVHLTTLSSNVIQAATEANELYIYDTLASSPVRSLMRNAESALNFETYRPTNYNVSRVGMLFPGVGGNGWPEGDFLFTRGLMSNNIVVMDESGYGPFVNNLAGDAPIVPAGTVTNLPGRVQVYADALDLRRTRIRGEGEVIVQTQHLISSSNAVVDSEHLSFFLTSTNENLRMVNLAKQEVSRMRGSMFMWSGAWNNEGYLISTNYSVSTNFDTNTPPVPIDVNITRADVTNYIVFNLHAMLVDGDRLLATLPVTVWDVVNRSDNLIIDDRMSVVQSFDIDATNFTLNGVINFTNARLDSWIGTSFFAYLDDFVWTNAPNLMRFTNTGTLNVPSTIHFGDDRPDPSQPMQNRPLDIWVNKGNMTTASLLVDSHYFQNSGTLTINGPLSLTGQNGSLEDGQSVSVQTTITPGNLRINNYSMRTRILNLNVPGNLSDAGFGTSNSVVVTRGFHLLRKPATGDLLGSTLQTILPNFAQIDHTWAGEDRGATTAGFANNAAVGSLVISTAFAQTIDPLAAFKGTGPGRALYVDYLDLGALGANWESWLEIDPSITIYYAKARLGITPPNLPNGIPQTPEEYLDGKFGGHLRWVRDYAGGLSSVAVLVDGATKYMNSALRNSRVIDSDNDGIPNYFDATPLGGSTPGLVSGLVLKSALVKHNLMNNAKAFNLTWLAAPNTVYQIEVATDLVSPNWQILTLYTNKLSTDQPATFTDVKSSAVKQRFYRVRVKQ